MKKMDKNKTVLKEHIAALEKFLESEKPNLKEIATHAEAVSSQFGKKEMSEMKM